MNTSAASTNSTKQPGTKTAGSHKSSLKEMMECAWRPLVCDSNHAIKINKTSYLPGATFLEKEHMGVSSDGCSSPAGPQSILSIEAQNAQGYKRRSSSQFFALTQILATLSHPSKTRKTFSTSSCLESSAAGKRTHEKNPTPSTVKIKMPDRS